jgi:signal transduction histidine kinase
MAELDHLQNDMARSGAHLIYGSGEMAELIRAFDWSSTPLGSIENWSDALLITVNTMLGNRQPNFLFWGGDLLQFYNDAFRPSLGFDKHPKAVGQRGTECWAEIWYIIGPQIEAVMQRGESFWFEDQLVPFYRNGKLEEIYWTYSYSPVRDAEGKIQGTLVTCSETTGRVLAERALRTEQERLLSLFHQAPAFLTVLRGPEHVIEMRNLRYQELIGPRDVIGKKVSEAVPESVAQGFLETLDTVYRTGETFVAQGHPIDLQRTPGKPLERRYIDFVYQAIREIDGSISGILVLGVDVTDRKKAETALLNTEKLAAVGRLAASIAHEINNPLSSVTNLLYLARHSDDINEMHGFLEIAERELRRVSVISNQTLRFHRQSTKPLPVRSEELFESVLSIHQGRLVNSSIEVQKQFRTESAVVCFDGEIRQVLNNLVGNAIDAMQSAGGTLFARSREATDWRTGERGLVFTVADTGTGMSHEVLKRIFEPFFTTKGIGGTGLGLWVCTEIVNRHHGVLRVKSRQGADKNGTVFSLFLPFNERLVGR